jgi:hypothetical protein
LGIACRGGVIAEEQNADCVIWFRRGYIRDSKFRRQNTSVQRNGVLAITARKAVPEPTINTLASKNEDKAKPRITDVIRGRQPVQLQVDYQKAWDKSQRY